MRCGGYECKKNEKESARIPDQVGNDRLGRSRMTEGKKQSLSFDRPFAVLRITKRENGRGKEGPHEMRRVRMQKK